MTWRDGQGGAVPGQSLVVSAPAQGRVTDGLPCAEGPAQERAWCGAVLATVQANDRWSQDRHCCPWACLCESDRRGAGFLTRQQEGVRFEPVHGRRSVGRSETEHVAEPRVQVGEAQGGVPLWRRLQVKWAQATRDGDRVLSLLTHLPLRKASAKRVARF